MPACKGYCAGRSRIDLKLSTRPLWAILSPDGYLKSCFGVSKFDAEKILGWTRNLGVVGEVPGLMLTEQKELEIFVPVQAQAS